MKRLFYAALFSTLILAACGDDDSGNPFVANEDSSSSSFLPLSSSNSRVTGSIESSASSSSKRDSGSVAGMTSCSSSESFVSSSSFLNEDSSSSIKVDWPTDSIIDDRDGQKYKIVKIDRLWWFAQNLNYETENSHCYNDSTKYCDKYGRLYTWAAAVGKSEEECGERHICNLSLPVQGVCPPGWHVPSNYEWNDLFVFVGGDKVAGEVLRNSSEGGFALLYAGRINFAGDFIQEGRSACIWSSNEVGEDDSYYVDFYYTFSKVFLKDADKTDGYSVRCVKDES
ncbi:fibrobacter succinogenes major paralogous domain-containing protein [Fibrobacter succinogenes]|uniref:fibrobacter succinogenes major paralogous domain-containing protein n=1 Tax=Fibrobacter succinogenes TaxID=833 RepID=UPI00156A2A84|nr:fibrobacter succinogenes major paralogous domain-containing protein [Fibrobacter succinogenes]